MVFVIRQHKLHFLFTRNDSGVVADVSIRFANESKNLVSLDALVKTGTLGTVTVDPASLTAGKMVNMVLIPSLVKLYRTALPNYRDTNRDL